MATIVVNKERCKACGLCVAFCPKSVIRLSKEINQKGFHPAELTNGDQCTGCAYCALMCPEVAIEVYREEKSNLW